jgi:hypothetical protein
MIKNFTRTSIVAILFGGVISLGIFSPLKAVYAHTFFRRRKCSFPSFG